MHQIIIGEYKQDSVSIGDPGRSPDDSCENNTNKTIDVFDISFTTIPEGMALINQDNKNDIGLISLDAIFCPYTTAFTHDNLPTWINPTGAASGDITCISLNPFNPEAIYTSGSVTGVLQPDVFYESGHNIQLYNSFDAVGLNTYEDLSPYNELAITRNPTVTGIRAVGLKAPIVLTGPGYDTSGNPVPTGVGGSGWHPEAFHNPSLWKSGPVDLRWDNTRGVWTGTGGSDLVRFKITDYNAQLGENAIGCDHVIADIIGEPCNRALSSGDSIKVYDPDFAYFNMPLDLLIGMYGYAVKMYNPMIDDPIVEVDPVDCVLDQYAEGACYWNVVSLSCAEEEIVF